MYDNFSSFQAFSYFHFLVNEKEEFDIYKVFRQYDTGNMFFFKDLGAKHNNYTEQSIFLPYNGLRTGHNLTVGA